MSLDKIGYGFTSEEAAILFGLDLNEHHVSVFLQLNLSYKAQTLSFQFL